MSTDIVPYQQIERMAQAVAKSNLFAVKTPEAAISLMLIAQAENIHPAKAMMEYDLIQGKPALKSSAMLARFQAAGGKVEWLENSDAKVTGRFTHPAGGTITVTWDDKRVETAGLTNPMHKKFPAQMKRARCVSEGVRAVFPGVSPANLYTPEELNDIETPPIVVSATTALSGEVLLASSEVDEYLERISNAATGDELRAVYGEAYKAAQERRDSKRMETLRTEYEARKGELGQAKAEEQI